VSTPPLDVTGILNAFSGVVRLFPLPSMVVFPDALVPLKVFEPRYVEMVNDALEDDRLIGMALLKPGYEKDYDGTPDIYPVVCLGRILQHKRLQNGHIDFWLYGLERARIDAEIESEGDVYRRARVELLPDRVEDRDRDRVARQVRRALEMVPGRRSVLHELRRLAREVRGVSAAPGRLADAVATVSDLKPKERYDLLAEAGVAKRFTRLIAQLEKRAAKDAPPAPLPPDVWRN
jgi:Lon protease-like protein